MASRSASQQDSYWRSALPVASKCTRTFDGGLWCLGQRARSSFRPSSLLTASRALAIRRSVTCSSGTTRRPTVTETLSFTRASNHGRRCVASPQGARQTCGRGATEVCHSPAAAHPPLSKQRRHHRPSCLAGGHPMCSDAPTRAASTMACAISAGRAPCAVPRCRRRTSTGHPTTRKPRPLPVVDRRPTARGPAGDERRRTGLHAVEVRHHAAIAMQASCDRRGWAAQ